MQQRILTLAAVALIAIGSAALTGCEDSAVLPPADATMIVNSTAATIDPGGTTARATVSAQILTMENAAAPNVTVTFEADAGTVSPTTIETDSGGVATAILVMSETDDDIVNVTARSGSLSEIVPVDNPVGPPDAQAIIVVDKDSPASLIAGQSDLPIIFRSESVDPDDTNPITCARWRVTYGGGFEVIYDSGPNFEVRTDHPQLGISTASPEQELGVELAVTESLAGAVACDDTTRFSDDIDFLGGFLLCRNQPPTAVIDEGVLVNATLPGNGNPVQVTLNATGSSDPETNIGEYRWDCDNSEDDLVSTSSQGVCGFSFAGTYTVELEVTDVNINFPGCRLSDKATITVIVDAP